MRLFLSGPMRGLPRYNFDAFAVATAALRAHGHTVLSPAENDARLGWSPFEGEDPSPETLQSMYRWDLRAVVGPGPVPYGYVPVGVVDADALTPADGIALLPGWRQSEGAKLEALVATRCGVPLYRFDLEHEGCLRPLEAQNLVIAFGHEPAVNA